MGGGARRAAWSDLAHRCCLVLCTAAIASIGAAALGAPTMPAAKRTAASRPSDPPATSHTATRRTTVHTARWRKSIRHAARRRIVPDDRTQARSGDRLNDNTVAIIAGEVGSTDLVIAQDLAAVLDDGDNLRILPMAGAGGPHNIRDVRLMKNVDLGIAETSLLAYLRASNELGTIDNRIVYIAKLFNEEMHVLVRADSEFVAIEQLGGRTVSLGEQGSGTQVVAHDVLGRLGIAVHEANMGVSDAIESLKAGDIDAVVLVGGRPIPALVGLSAGFRILPVPFAKPLRDDFLPAALSSADYPQLIDPGHRIETLAVGTALFAYNWPKDGARYRKIEKFVSAFFPRLAALQRPPRHPKWREVNVAASIAGWKRASAAQDWLAEQGDVAANEDVAGDGILGAARAPAGGTSGSGNRR